MLFICYEKCSTCQKAKKFLDEHHLNYELRDIKSDNPAYEELKQWYALANLPLKRFFNTSGKAYRERNIKERIKDMSEDEILRLLSTDGMLVKRPLLIDGERMIVGFDETKYQDLVHKKVIC